MHTGNIKTFLIITFLSLSVISFAQKKVFLKWKLQPKEVISYKTTMSEIDTANYKDFSIDASGLFGKLGSIAHDSLFSSDKDIEAKKFFTKLNDYVKNGSLITYLTKNKKGIIDISMTYKQADTTSGNVKDTSVGKEYAKFIEELTKGIQLRGAINDSGAIESFYTKNDQKNLIALFFQLPGKPVKVGDSWPLDVHFISMDQNFKCDTSFHKNIVTLIGTKKVNGETIAVMRYDIVEYVYGDFMSPYDGSNKKTMMKMTCNALAEFSVDKGRWISYDGIMSLIASGVLSSHTTKKVSLQPN